MPLGITMKHIEGTHGVILEFTVTAGIGPDFTLEQDELAARRMQKYSALAYATTRNGDYHEGDPCARTVLEEFDRFVAAAVGAGSKIYIELTPDADPLAVVQIVCSLNAWLIRNRVAPAHKASTRHRPTTPRAPVRRTAAPAPRPTPADRSAADLVAGAAADVVLAAFIAALGGS